jgi:hypothetical protein
MSRVLWEGKPGKGKPGASLNLSLCGEYFFRRRGFFSPPGASLNLSLCGEYFSRRRGFFSPPGASLNLSLCGEYFFRRRGLFSPPGASLNLSLCGEYFSRRRGLFSPPGASLNLSLSGEYFFRRRGLYSPPGASLNLSLSGEYFFRMRGRRRTGRTGRRGFARPPLKHYKYIYKYTNYVPALLVVSFVAYNESWRLHRLPDNTRAEQQMRAWTCTLIGLMVSVVAGFVAATLPLRFPSYNFCVVTSCDCNFSLNSPPHGPATRWRRVFSATVGWWGCKRGRPPPQDRLRNGAANRISSTF